LIGRSAVPIDNQILLYGGMVPSKRLLEISQALKSFKIDENKWSNVSLCEMCSAGPLRGYGAVEVGTQLFIFGGNDGHKDRDDLFKYDLGMSCIH
jgi:hypothetical protein